MKKVTLIINDELYGMLGLTASASDTDIATAIKAGLEKAKLADKLEKDNLKLTNELGQLKEQTVTADVQGQIEAALDSHTITKEVADKLAVKFEKDPEGLKDLLAAMKPYEPVVDKLKTKGTGTPDERKDFENKTWDELDRSTTAINLVNLKAKFPELFNAKYRAAFGKEYSEVEG